MPGRVWARGEGDEAKAFAKTGGETLLSRLWDEVCASCVGQTAAEEMDSRADDALSCERGRFDRQGRKDGKIQVKVKAGGRRNINSRSARDNIPGFLAFSTLCK